MAATRRLKASNKPQKVLQVPQKDMPAAVKAMQEAELEGQSRIWGEHTGVQFRKRNNLRQRNLNRSRSQ